MIFVNGKELDEHGLRARVKLRTDHRLYPPRMLELLEKDLLRALAEADAPASAALYSLRRALEEEDEERDRLREEGSRWKRLLRAASAEQEQADGAAPPREAAETAPFSGQPRAQAEEKEKRPPLRRIIAHAVTVRVVQGVGEGYFQQLKQFNIFMTRELEILHRLLRSGRRGPYPGRDGRNGSWLSPRPAWDEETIAYAAGICGRGAVLVGIPGTAAVEALWERGVLALAVDDHDRAVAEAQARFCPARFHLRPLELLEEMGGIEADLLAVPFPACMEGSQLEGLLRWAGKNLPGGGKVLLGTGGREEESRLSCEDGFVRPWPPGYLRALLERAGFDASGGEGAGAGFLLGEKRAGT